MNTPYFNNTGLPAASVPMCSARSLKLMLPINRPIGGMMTSATSELTILPNADPITTPTARSMTLPFIANSLNSEARLMAGSPRGLVILTCSLGGQRTRTKPKPQTKGRPRAAFHQPETGIPRCVLLRCGGLLLTRALRRSLRVRGSVFSFIRLARALLLGGRCFSSGYGRGAVYQLHQGHGRGVPSAGQHPQNPRVSTRASLETRTEIHEQLLNHIRIAQTRKREAAIRIPVGFREGDEGLDHPTQLFCLRQSRTDRLVAQERNAHVPEHGMPVRAVTGQLPA